MGFRHQGEEVGVQLREVADVLLFLLLRYLAQVLEISAALSQFSTPDRPDSTPSSPENGRVDLWPLPFLPPERPLEPPRE